MKYLGVRLIGLFTNINQVSKWEGEEFLRRAKTRLASCDGWIQCRPRARSMHSSTTDLSGPSTLAPVTLS